MGIKYKIRRKYKYVSEERKIGFQDGCQAMFQFASREEILDALANALAVSETVEDVILNLEENGYTLHKMGIWTETELAIADEEAKKLFDGINWV